jgi:hypothetical protein
MGERHLLVVLDSSAKPIESAWFKFSDYKSTELCMAYDGYQGWAILAKREFFNSHGRLHQLQRDSLLLEDFADDSNLFSSPCAFRTFIQFRVFVSFGQLSKQSNILFSLAVGLKGEVQEALRTSGSGFCLPHKSDICRILAYLIRARSTTGEESAYDGLGRCYDVPQLY